MNPLISCLCPTRNKPSIVKNAIKYFKNQIYPNKELILVTDEKNPYIEDLKKLTSENIKLFYAPHKSTIGTLRNISIDNANGEYVATWDDDDVHHEDRIFVQYHAMKGSRKEACYLRRVLVNDVITGDKGISKDWRGMEGSMVALKSKIPRYDDTKTIAEDSPIKRFFVSNHKSIIINEPHLYVYNFHSNNTCKHEHLKAIIDVII